MARESPNSWQGVQLQGWHKPVQVPKVKHRSCLKNNGAQGTGTAIDSAKYTPC